jgi:hypothetical protein
VLGVILLLFANGLITGSDQAIFGNAVRLYGGNVQVHAPGYRQRASRLPLLPLADADAVVVNTCGFVEAAKKDSIDTLLSAADETFRDFQVLGKGRGPIAVGFSFEVVGVVA